MTDPKAGWAAPKRLEFGACGGCPYLSGGSPAFCYACAHSTMEPLADLKNRCEVCDQTFVVGETTCKNPVCNMGQKWFEWNYAIAMRSGTLQAVINAYKYSGPASDNRGWAAIFGRILVGFLDANAVPFQGTDLIVASPAFIGPGGRRAWDHIREILIAADAEQVPPGRWPFDLADIPAIVKSEDTPAMTGLKYQARRANAEGPVRAALSVPDPSRTAGRDILVVDDVFTDGLTMREVARALRLQGRAARVHGVTLARQPFGRH